MFRAAFIVLAGFAFALACSHAAEVDNGLASAPSNGAIYDTNPNHLWNRLHRALFLRTGTDGLEYGLNQLDPLLWFRTRHLLEGVSHDGAVRALDEFIASHGETLIDDPLKRAVLQRDLWAVFDWSALRASDKSRRDLQVRLARIIPRLALTKQQIDALQDNYAAAAQSHVFESEFNEADPAKPFLPSDLFAANGSWVCVGLNGEQSIAPFHLRSFGGRSAFLIFMRTPGGRQKTVEYLRQFREFPRPYIYKPDQFHTNQVVAVHSPDLPQFPDGTTFVLMRQAILIDQDGQPLPTHLTESVQIRRYNDTHPKPGPYGRPPPESQSLFEFVLSRKQLLDGVAGGLRARLPEERDFRQFDDKGFDPFEMAEAEHKPLSMTQLPKALDCMSCHLAPGVFSVSSFVQAFETRTADLPQLSPVEIRQQRDAACLWKQGRFNWGLLDGIWARQ